MQGRYPEKNDALAFESPTFFAPVPFVFQTQGLQVFIEKRPLPTMLCFLLFWRTLGRFRRIPNYAR